MTYVLITILIVLGIYPFLLYPLTLVAARRLGLHRPVRRSGTPKGKVSVLLCCYNEERWIKRKLENLALLNSHETLVYADGCTDRTFDILEAWDGAARISSDNVLHGDMSLVGPRPHATGAKAAGLLYPDVVTDYFMRDRIKPGLTGWSQVIGWRGETDSDLKLKKRVSTTFNTSTPGQLGRTYE